VNIQADAAASAYARIVSTQIVNSNPSAYGNSIQRYSKLKIRFFAKLPSTLSDYTADDTAFGVSGQSANANAQNAATFFLKNIAGINTLYARTDNGGVDEDTDVSSGITISNWNKYEIEVTSNDVKFYINGTLVATHSTQKPVQPQYIGFRATTPANGANLYITGVYVWYEV
jgi:hypothetical protein